MSDTQAAMREFRFLDDKRKASGLSQAEEEHYQLLAAQLGVQPVPGYFATDGNWYPVPAEGYPGYTDQAGGYYDPNAIDPATGYPYPQQQGYDPNYPQGYDPNAQPYTASGQQYDELGNPVAPAYDPNDPQGYYPEQPQEQWPQQYDPNAYAPPQQAYPQQQPVYPPQQQYTPAPYPSPSQPGWAPHSPSPSLSSPPMPVTAPFGQQNRAPPADDGPAEVGDDEVMEVTDDDVTLLDTSAPMGGGAKLNTRIATPMPRPSAGGLFGPGSRAILGAPVRPLPRSPTPSAPKTVPFVARPVPAPRPAPSKPTFSSPLATPNDESDLLGDLKSALNFDEPAAPEPVKPASSLLSARTMPPGTPEDSIPMLDLEPEASLSAAKFAPPPPAPVPAAMTTTMLPPGSPEDSIPMMDLEPEASMRFKPRAPEPVALPVSEPISLLDDDEDEVTAREPNPAGSPSGSSTEQLSAAAVEEKVAATAPTEPVVAAVPPPEPEPEAEAETPTPLSASYNVPIAESLPETPETAKTQPSLTPVKTDEERELEAARTNPRYPVPPELLDAPLPRTEPVPAPELFATPEPAISTPAAFAALSIDEEPSAEISAELTSLPPDERTPAPRHRPVPEPEPLAETDLEITPAEWERSSAEPSVMISPDIYSAAARPPPPPEPSESVLLSPELFTPPETKAVRPPPPPPPAEPSVFISPDLMNSSAEPPAPRPSVPFDISVTEPEVAAKSGLFGAQPVELGEPEEVLQREAGASLFGTPLAQLEDAEVRREPPPPPPMSPAPSFSADAEDVPVAPPSPEPRPVVTHSFTPSLEDLPPAQAHDFHVHLDDKPLPVENLELTGSADERVELAGTHDFITYSQAPGGAPSLEVTPDGDSFEVETGSLAEVANQQVLRPISAPAPVDLAPDMVPLASNADFLGNTELAGTGEAWTKSDQSLAIDAEVVEGEVVQGEIIQGVALEEDEDALPLEAEVVETELAPPSSAPMPIPLLAQAAPPPKASSPFSRVAIAPPEPAALPVPPRPVGPPTNQTVAFGAFQAAPHPAPAPPTNQTVAFGAFQPAPAPVRSAVPPARTGELFDRSGSSFGETPAAAIRVGGEHRVILHTVEGQVKRGLIRDADLNAELIALELSPGSVEKLSRTRVKALFFMLAPGEKPKAGAGDKLRVTFKDGRQVSGFSTDYKGTNVGFFVVPADSRTNTARIFIFRTAVDVVALD